MIKEAWDALIDAQPRGADAAYVLQLVASSSGLKVFAARRIHDAAPCLIISVQRDKAQAVDPPAPTHAFSCNIAEMKGLPPGCAGLVLGLEDPEFSDLFKHFADDICNEVTRTPGDEDALQAVRRCIDRWQRFVRTRGCQGLTEHEARGLVGELVVLRRLVERTGARRAVQGWKGPIDGLRDFELGDLSIEVKCCEEGDRGAVWVNDPTQLDDLPGKPVCLVVVQAVHTPSGTPLSQYVRTLAGCLREQPEAEDLFWLRLAEAGYLDSQADVYSAYRYTIGTVSAYKVDATFPLIRPADVPAEIEAVRFLLKLPGLSKWRVPTAQLLGSAQEIWGNDHD